MHEEYWETRSDRTTKIELFQLWINLPARQKADPAAIRYVGDAWGAPYEEKVQVRLDDLRFIPPRPPRLLGAFSAPLTSVCCAVLCCAVLCCAAQLDGRGKATRVRYALDEALLARAEQEGYRRGVSLEFRETTVSISLSLYPSIYLGRQRDASEPAAGVSGARHARAWRRMDPRRAAC